MLFILDHNVDRAVCKVIRDRGHNCEPVGAMGLAFATDEDLAVLADDKGAIFISHDVDFARRREENTFGYHVHLACSEPRAVEVMDRYLEDIITLVFTRDSIVMRASMDGVTPSPNSWV